MRSSLTNETLRELRDAIIESMNKSELEFKSKDFRSLLDELLKTIDAELHKGVSSDGIRRVVKDFLLKKEEV